MAKKIKKEKAEVKGVEIQKDVPIEESKPTKPKKEKKGKAPKKESKERNEFKHAIGTQSAQIDELLKKGSDLKTMAEKVGSSKGRVKSHIKHLEKDHDQKIQVKGDIYKLIK